MSDTAKCPCKREGTGHQYEPSAIWTLDPSCDVHADVFRYLLAVCERYGDNGFAVSHTVSQELLEMLGPHPKLKPNQLCALLTSSYWYVAE
jgi:hypothetical protein